MQNETDELRYFNPDTTRNSQASTVDIREDTLADATLKEDIVDENPWLADVVQSLNYSSPAVLVKVFNATPGEEHLAVYDRTEKRLAAGILQRMTDYGFHPIYAGVKALPYEVDGQEVLEQHGWAEFRIHDAAIADTIQVANDTTRPADQLLEITADTGGEDDE